MTDLPDDVSAVLPFSWPIPPGGDKNLILLNIVTAGDAFVPYLVAAIKEGADPMAFPHGGGWSPLLLAAAHGKIGCLTAIVEACGIGPVLEHQGTSIHAISVMHAAINYNRCGIVDYLLSQGAPVNGYLGPWASPIELALRKGQADMVDQLIRAGADIAKREAQLGRSLLSGFDAISLVFGNASAKAIFDAGADPNGKTTSGTTLLCQAVDNTNSDRVKLLLESGADPNLETERDFPPLHFAIRLPHLGHEFVKLLLAYGANPDGSPNSPGHLLCRAVVDRKDQSLRELIKGGATVNVYNSRFNDTPLGIAATYNDAACARILIEAGADVNGHPQSPNTPLGLAIVRQHEKMVALLLENGADVTHKNLIGETPLMLAVQRNLNPSIIEELIKAGARPFEPDRHGLTAYERLQQSWQANTGNADILRCLVACDAVRNRPASGTKSGPKPGP